MALSVKVGTFIGNGATSGNRSITGVGFQPKFVSLWTDGNSQASWQVAQRVTDSPGDTALWAQNGWASLALQDGFYSFDADGFTIQCGTDAGNQFLNANGATCYYIALGGDDVVSGKYTGNGTDNRSITGVGFQPIFVLYMGGNAHNGIKFNSSGASTDTTSFTYAAANVTNAIQAFESDGFQIGTSANPAVNANGTVYYYLAIKSGSNVYQNEYTGNASDNRDITGVGFSPDAIFIKSESAYQVSLWNSNHSGDASKSVGTTALVANYVQSALSDGFQIGTANDVNANAAIYGYIAFTEGVSASGPASLKTVNTISTKSTTQTLEFVGSVSGSSADITANGVVLDLTSLTGGVASAPVEGDIVVVAVAHCDPNDLSVGVATSGYTEISELYVSDVYDANLSVAYKVMGGTPDTSVTTDLGANATSGTVCVAHVWRGVDLTTPIDVTPTTATGIDSGNVNPAAITPTTAGAVVLVVGSSGHNGGTASAYTSYSSLENFTQLNVNTVRDSLCGIGSYDGWTSGAYDPDAWAFNDTSTSHSWASVTLALRPKVTPASVKTINGIAIASVKTFNTIA